MRDLQEVFTRLQKTKQKQKKIKAAYKDALSQTPDYESIAENLKMLREKKKRMEQEVKNSFTKEFKDLDDLRADSETDQELLNDIALNQLTSGQTVKVTDEYNNNYEPVFAVKFRKVYE